MTDMAILRETVAEGARQLAAQMATLCAELVRVPSVNGRHLEKDVVAVIEAYSARYGLPTWVTEAAPGRPTAVVGSSASGDEIAKDGLLLVAHSDTVPEGNPEAWAHAPFGAEIEGSRLYGRGACDNKGGLAAAFFALVLLQHAGLLGRTNAALLCVPDEESGATGRLGIVPLLRAEKLKARGAIYTYPGLDVLPIGHRGVLRLTLAARGEAIHSGSLEWQVRSRGANAVAAMADLLVELDRLDINAGLAPVGNVWGDLRGVVTPGTTISGGSGVSIVPQNCAATVDIRLIPGHTRERLLALIRDVLATVLLRHSRVTIELTVDSYAPPTQIPDDAAIVRAVQAACALVLPERPRIQIAGPANEGYLLNGGGIPTICGFGPNGEHFHAPDEYVDLPSLPIAATIYALSAVFLRDLPEL
jgi:succinyl-diaminopimelate desuccinylase